MQFLADESCDFAVVRALRAAGHDVDSVRELAPGAPDEHVIRMALDGNRTLLTEDRDFGQLVFASAAKSPGVIYLRFPAKAREAMVEAVLKLVERHGTTPITGFVVIQPGRIRLSGRMGIQE